MPFWQHPFGQVVALHAHAPPVHATPALHCAPPPHLHCPATHASAAPALHVVHAAPPVPHAVSVLPAMHVEPLQQPLGQLAALQTHWPDTQRCVELHSLFEPQRQLPDDEQ